MAKAARRCERPGHGWIYPSQSECSECRDLREASAQHDLDPVALEAAYLAQHSMSVHGVAAVIAPYTAALGDQDLSDQPGGET